jgi:cytochrome c5
MDQDRKFFDTFMLILGGMLGLTVLIYFIASDINQALADQAHETEFAENRQMARLQPVGQVQIAGQAGTAAPQPAPAPQTAAAPAAAKQDIDGQAIYQNACVACHGAGVAGAPKVGDTAAWAPRIAKGMATLKDHALHGFNGETGIMPAKGGRTDLSDAEVVAALEYMVSQSK